MSSPLTTSGELIIRLDHIIPNPDNVRTEAGDVGDLAASIKELGLVQPLLVTPIANREGYYILQDGFRRWTAARFVTDEVRCFLYEPVANKSAAAQTVIIGLVTNLHNKALSEMERAHAFGQLRREQKMTMAQIAKAVGCSETTVSNSLALLDLDLASQRRLERRTITKQQALKGVQSTRAKTRKKKGQKPVAPVWEPEHFTEHHMLAKMATKYCNARDHSLRRRFGGACHACWEAVIRADQMKMDAVTAAAGDIVFRSPADALLHLAQAEGSNGRY